MPRFIIERNYAKQVEMDQAKAEEIRLVNADLGVEWIFSFLSLDRRKTYCLYEAPNAELIREAARRVGAPADAVIEISEELRPEAFLGGLIPDGQ